jgi:hypothetical protein
MAVPVTLLMRVLPRRRARALEGLDDLHCEGVLRAVLLGGVKVVQGVL